MKVLKRIPRIIWLLLGAFVLRLLLIKQFTYGTDFYTFVAWSDQIRHFGFSHFYDNTWSDYLPGYMYVLWILGELKNALPTTPLELIYKMPAILADLATGLIIFKVVKTKGKERLGLIAASLYLYNPAVFANSTNWGQVDSITSLFALLSVYSYSINPILSAAMLALGATVKPQAALAVFAVGALILSSSKKTTTLKNLIDWQIIARALVYTAAVLVFAFIIFVPFSPNTQIFEFIGNRLSTTFGQYQFTSVNAFNFWGIKGFWLADSDFNHWGGNLITAAASLLSVYWLFIKRKPDSISAYKVLAISLLTGFLFMTRMHERHLLPALAPIAISVVFSPGVLLAYLVLSASYLSNLHYSYVWAVNNFKESISQPTIVFTIILSLGSWAMILYDAYLGKSKLFNKLIPEKLSASQKVNDLTLPKPKAFVIKYKNYLLAIILLFSLVTRLYNLHLPQEEYFDEVYHAFTAQVMLQGDPKAWEWWNTPPEGYAYEWTHPPLAKLGMAAGMAVLGENATGWRVPGVIVGVLSIFLIYKIVLVLFKNETAALLSAALYSLDGMGLVMSRIGMNDMYLVFFILLSIYLYLKNKYLFSALTFGAAAASKWSAAWAVPIFLLMHFKLGKKFTWGYIWFLVLPPLVYLASYIPMFTTGHDLEIFTGVQKQMWWYHTGLDAEHPFTSMWYTWPLMLRPVWVYTSGLVEGMISNIYIQGNPVILWSGLASVAAAIYLIIKTRSSALLILVFSYIVFFIPWAASPRIMFFYHYFPSVPFLTMILGVVLTKINNNKLTIGLLTVALVVFIYFYPNWAGLNVSKELSDSYHWFRTW